MKHRTRLIALLIAAVMLAATLPASFAVKGEDPGYLDVAEDAWYYDAVYFAEGRGLMSGYDFEHFAPPPPFSGLSWPTH